MKKVWRFFSKFWGASSSIREMNPGELKKKRIQDCFSNQPGPVSVGDLGDVKITDWDTSKDEKELV